MKICRSQPLERRRTKNLSSVSDDERKAKCVETFVRSVLATNTPQIPVRLCSSISSLLALDSISDLPSNKSLEKERLLSASLSHTLHDILPFGSEHDEVRKSASPLDAQRWTNVLEHEHFERRSKKYSRFERHFGRSSLASSSRD